MKRPPLRVRVLHHREADGWWSESPEAPGWLGMGATYAEVERRAEEGLRAHFDHDDLAFEHHVVDVN